MYPYSFIKKRQNILKIPSDVHLQLYSKKTEFTENYFWYTFIVLLKKDKIYRKSFQIDLSSFMKKTSRLWKIDSDVPL